MKQLVDVATLRTELKAALTVTKGGMAGATAEAMIVCMQHLAKNVGRELAALENTNRALAEVAAAAPDRLAQLEARIIRLEASR